MDKKIALALVPTVCAVSLQAAYAPGLSSVETTKPWSVSTSLRGFYDDNYTTAPSSRARDSYGSEISPKASVNFFPGQTHIGASYAYSMKYYFDRKDNRADHSHEFNGSINHPFSERYKMSLSESFVMAQEPQLIDPAGLTTVPLRTEGNNIRNSAAVDFSAMMTELLSLQMGYANTFYDYEQKAVDIKSPANPMGAFSRSAILDRMEHRFVFDTRWQIQPQTVGIVGYDFGVTEYDAQDPLYGTTPANSITSRIRDNRTHRFVLGADHNFNPRLNGSIRLGMAYREFNQVPAGGLAIVTPGGVYLLSKDDVSPYADGRLSYQYGSGNYLQVGARHDRNQTDLSQDQESTAFYGSVTHKITPNMTANGLLQYQHSAFNGGIGVDGEADDYYTLGLNLAYQINKFLVGEAGYNFDKLNSDVPDRPYTRNRLYIGLRATY